MEENSNDDNSTEPSGESAQGEGLLTDVARAIGSTLGKAAAALGGSVEPQAAAAPKRRRQEKVGLVTSDKMTKTVVVRVERLVRHPKYKRYIRRRARFMAHNELEAKTGDTVRIIETRPMSARKRWRVVEIIQKAR
jgi:small subunit ribosomal protein S17